MIKSEMVHTLSACRAAASARSGLQRSDLGPRDEQQQRHLHRVAHASGQSSVPRTPDPAGVADRTTCSDGVTVQLTRSGGRWLVSRLLFC